MPAFKRKGKGSTKPIRVNPVHFIFLFSTLGFLAALYNTLSFYSNEREKDRIATNNDGNDGTTIASKPALADQGATLDAQARINNGEPADAEIVDEMENDSPLVGDYSLPSGFQRILDRATENQGKCEQLSVVPSEIITPKEIDVPPFGIVNALQEYRPQSQKEVDDWQCEIPPSTECDIERMSVIFLGYGADRLSGVRNQIQRMLGKGQFKDIVEEVILVWNNPKPLNESDQSGALLYDWSQRPTNPFFPSQPNRFRVFYPIELGLPSTLMNRYHPLIKPKSRALLYYDDDGPFYTFNAIQSNFELWKRNSDSQTGAMARAFTLSPRQQAEKQVLLGGELDDRHFVSHCRHKGDEIRYDYRFFENFHANMVLPSGSMIHRDYLCFIWHPALKKLRKFVFDHMVHPDDMTVSTIVSHVSGRAPHPYSRRLPQPEGRRRLNEEVANTTSPEGMWRTKDWGKLRSIALNSVIAYFGSINSGSFGWCYKTKYHERDAKSGRHVCKPEIAKVGQLPWMQRGGYGNDKCPS